tara:strand:- start:3668 stop:4321 length:654 start_codon:yes stop_codon:yes gene_type:complete
MNHELFSKYPDLSIKKTSRGYTLIDKQKKMSLFLSLDEYKSILAENKSHPLNKIIKKSNLDILDCTGGFARDSAVIASLGNNVTLVERNPMILALLLEASKRIDDHEIKKIFENIKIRFGNCIDFIRSTNKIFDYIYFDFMFNINKSALPSKKEQFLRKIVKNNLRDNVMIINETIERVTSKIIIKEHIQSNDFKHLDIINTYREKTVKYHLINGKN